MLRNNAEHLYEFLPSFLLNVRGEEDIKAWFDKQDAAWNARNLFIFGARNKVTGVYVGESYLANPDCDIPHVFILAVRVSFVKLLVGKKLLER